MDNQKVSELSVNRYGQTKAERLERERLDIEHDGYGLLGLPFMQPPPSTFTFDESDIETNRLAWRMELWELTGGGRPLSEVPHDIPAEYIPEIKSILEPRARRDYEFDIQSWPERVKEREGYVAKARVLREKVPPAIELLRASCEPDPDGAHRPIYLGHVGIEATACLDCEWFTHDSWGGVEGGSRISNHRSLHWNPPHDELCHMSIVDGLTQHRGGIYPDPIPAHPVSENVRPRLLPTTAAEMLGVLQYPPVAVVAMYHRNREPKAKGVTVYLCQACHSKVVRTSPGAADWEFSA